MPVDLENSARSLVVIDVQGSPAAVRGFADGLRVRALTELDVAMVADSPAASDTGEPLGRQPLKPGWIPRTDAHRTLAELTESGRYDFLFHIRALADYPFAWDSRIIQRLRADPYAYALSPLTTGDLARNGQDAQLHRQLPGAALLDGWVQRMGDPYGCLVDAPHGSHTFVDLHRLPDPELLQDVFAAPGPRSHGGNPWPATGAERVLLDGTMLLGTDTPNPPAGRASRLLETRYADLDSASRYVLDKPVKLHIAHSWGGGLERWLNDFINADSHSTSLVLRSVGNWGQFGEALFLFRAPDLVEPIGRFELNTPIADTAPSHPHYRAILHQIIRRYRVSALHVSSLIGHSLDALTLMLPTVVTLHDYYPFCPALNVTFEQECERCESHDTLARCFADNPANRFFDRLVPQQTLAIRELYRRHIALPSVHVVTPSPGVAEKLRTLGALPEGKSAHTIPHGLSLTPFCTLPIAGKRLTVLVLGRLTPEKGGNLLSEALPRLSRFCDFVLLGCGSEAAEKLSKHDAVRAVPTYDYTELPEYVLKARPDLGLLLSVVPETFSYTLSELFSFGIPPVATTVGAFRDRITDGANGFLIEPSANALCDRMEQLNLQRDELRRAAAALSLTPPDSTEAMVRAYSELHFGDQCVKSLSPMAYVCPDPSEQGRELAVRYDHGAVTETLKFLAYIESKVINSPRLGRLSKAVAHTGVRAARFLVQRLARVV